MGFCERNWKPRMRFSSSASRSSWRSGWFASSAALHFSSSANSWSSSGFLIFLRSFSRRSRRFSTTTRSLRINSVSTSSRSRTGSTEPFSCGTVSSGKSRSTWAKASNVSTPIIVLSALGDEVDKVLLLEIGADDYVVKPFGTRELLARIRAVLRRASPDARKVVHFSDVEVDLERRLVRRRGEELKLTPAEYNLLTYFLQNPDRPLTRDMILNSVWGYEFFPNTRTVDAHVVKLRQKLEPDPNTPRHFLTVHGVGYRFLP